MSDNSTASIEARLHTACELINNDKTWHENHGNQWHLDAGKLESLLADCDLRVCAKTQDAHS